ncbi:MAG: hypothetical protein RLZZ293_477 [Pseudomonadota bacterium]|jgi:hypothetical protein
MPEQIKIVFERRWLIFFILLEGLTVPLVASSNKLAVQNIVYMAIMGFVVAFICVLSLCFVLKRYLLRNAPQLLGVAIDDITNLWYLGIIAGFLLMIMFTVQDIMYHHGAGDFSVGFTSGFLSVAISLVIYELLAHYCNLAISFKHDQQIWQIRFTQRDILLLALIFAVYEFFVCPITSLWVPLQQHRILVASISGLAGGLFGGILLIVISYCLRSSPPSICLRPSKININN